MPSRIYVVHSSLYSATAYVCDADFNDRSEYALDASYCYTMTSSDNYDFISTQFGSLLVSKTTALIYNANALTAVGYPTSTYVISTSLFGISGYGGAPASVALSNHTLAYQVYTPSFTTRLVNLSNSSNLSTTKRNYLLVCDSIGAYSLSVGYTTSSTGYVFYQNTTARTSNVQNHVPRTQVSAHYIFNETNNLYIANLGWSRFTLSTCALHSRLNYPADLVIHPAIVSMGDTRYVMSMRSEMPYNSYGYLGCVYKVHNATWEIVDYDKGPVAQIRLNWGPVSIVNCAPYNKISFTGMY